VFINLTPFVPLSFEGEGEGYGREARPPLNPPFIHRPSSGVFKRGAAPLSTTPPLPLAGEGDTGAGVTAR